MDKNNAMGYITISLLVIVIGLLLFENHQIDLVKHAVGVEESMAEEELHNRFAEREFDESTGENSPHSEE